MITILSETFFLKNALCVSILIPYILFDNKKQYLIDFLTIIF